jgi:MFS family permease
MSGPEGRSPGDVMVVVTALTAIRRHLGASLADLEWTVNAYTLSFAVLLMTAAALGDRLGRRRVFAAGLMMFAVSSAGCALAPDAAALIAARVVQSAGAATIMPMALALLNGAFPPARRGWAIGIYGGVTALAAVAGPGWGSLEVIGTLAGGAAAAAAFAAWERRAACPMIPARLFRSPAFSAGNTAIFMINASLTGVIFLMPQFQQVVAGQGPLGSGLRLLPWGSRRSLSPAGGRAGRPGRGTRPGRDRGRCCRPLEWPGSLRQRVPVPATSPWSRR